MKVFALVQGVLVLGSKTEHTRDAIVIQSFPEYPEANCGYSFAGLKLIIGDIYYTDPGTMHLISELP